MQAIPAVFAFYNGEILTNFVGCPSKEEIDNWVANVAQPEETLRARDDVD